MPLSTTHRLIRELAEWGAVERGDDGLYRIGLRLWEIGSLTPRGPGVREAALPFLEDLSQITRENVQQGSASRRSDGARCDGHHGVDCLRR